MQEQSTKRASPRPRITTNCQQCGATFLACANRVERGGGKWCSQACYHTARTGHPCEKRQARRPSRTCIGCGTTFTVSPSKLRYGPVLWCSAECRYATPGWSKVLHPGKQREAHCQTCGQAFTVVRSEVGRYCSRRCLGTANGKRQAKDPTKHREYICQECGTRFNALACLSHRKRFCSRSCTARWTCRHRRLVRPTSIELALHAALTAAGIPTEREYKTGRYNIDLAIPAARLAIEADGTYWHSLPKQQAADARKDAALGQAGWRVLRFGENAITTDVDACVQAVRAALGPQWPLI